MKRDMELIRQIALRIEESPGGFAPQPLIVDDYTESQIGYHVLLMIEGGLIDGADITSQGDETPQGIATRLTWAGHEFLDAARDKTRWEQTKVLVGRAGGVSFPVLMETLAKAAMRSLGIP